MLPGVSQMPPDASKLPPQALSCPSQMSPGCPPDASHLLRDTSQQENGVGPETIMDSPQQVWCRTENYYGLSGTGLGSDPKQLWTLQNRSGVGPKTICSFWIWRAPSGTPQRTQNKMEKCKIKWKISFYFAFFHFILQNKWSNLDQYLASDMQKLLDLFLKVDKLLKNNLDLFWKVDKFSKKNMDPRLGIDNFSQIIMDSGRG